MDDPLIYSANDVNVIAAAFVEERTAELRAAFDRQSARLAAMSDELAALATAHANYRAMDTAWNEEFERLWPRLEAAEAMADAIDDDPDATPRCRGARDAYRAVATDHGDAPFEDHTL